MLHPPTPWGGSFLPTYVKLVGSSLNERMLVLLRTFSRVKIDERSAERVRA